jgi:hypothetical protein
VPSVIVLFDNFKGSLVERGNKQSVRTNDFVKRRNAAMSVPGTFEICQQTPRMSALCSEEPGTWSVENPHFTGIFAVAGGACF